MILLEVVILEVVIVDGSEGLGYGPNQAQVKKDSFVRGFMHGVILFLE